MVGTVSMFKGSWGFPIVGFKYIVFFFSVSIKYYNVTTLKKTKSENLKS